MIKRVFAIFLVGIFTNNTLVLEKWIVVTYINIFKEMYKVIYTHKKNSILGIFIKAKLRFK
jgi:hypothetical protein